MTTGPTRSSGTATARSSSSTDGQSPAAEHRRARTSPTGGRSSPDWQPRSMPPSAILDAELVVFDDDGRPSFELVQRSGVGSDREAVLHLFDVLPVDGTDTIGLPYLDRRRLLDATRRTGATTGSVPAHRVGDGAALLAATAEQRPRRRDRQTGRLDVPTGHPVEGLDQDQEPAPGRGRRSAATPRERATGRRRSGHCSSARADESGGCDFAGGVGTGFDQPTLDRADRTAATAIRTDTCPFDPPPPAKHRRGAHWVEPVLDGSDRDRRVHQRRARPPRQLRRAGRLTVDGSTGSPIAEALDAADPLASWRDEFVIVDPDLIYLDGNSLGHDTEAHGRSGAPRRRAAVGRRPDHVVVAARLARPAAHGRRLLAPLLGAPPGEVAVHESTTVGIFQLVNVALDLDGHPAGPAPVIAVDDARLPDRPIRRRGHRPAPRRRASGTASTTSTASTS